MLGRKIVNILPYNVAYVLRKLYPKLINSMYYLFRIFPIDSKKIVISNYNGKGYGDNGKYIVEEILRRNLGFNLVWLVNDDCDRNFPEKIRRVKHGSIKAIYEQVTAKVWIDNCRKSSYVRKRNKQFYMQTWHGGIALKKIEKDAENKLDPRYIDNAKNDSKMADIFISNSKFCTDMYKKAFWYSGNILECGSPRNDILFDSSNKRAAEKIRVYFGINKDVRILLYAPTFRLDLNTEVYNIDFESVIKALNIKFGGEWNVLLRLHPNMSKNAGFVKFDSKIKNASNYDDMYELLSASDILITDYSSTMFEFSFAYKPVFLYATDIYDYEEDRNFYFDIYTLPYKLAENNSQLIINIQKFDYDDYLKELKEFLLKLGLFEEGKASDKAVKIIEQFIEK